ncbi:hypothetical protein EON64_19360, partial [archaeon]
MELLLSVSVLFSIQCMGQFYARRLYCVLVLSFMLAFNKSFAWRSLLRSQARLHSRVYLSQARIPADESSLDACLLSSHADMVISHVMSRHSDASLIEKIKGVQMMREERNACQKQRDQARGVRKKLSREIGQMMQAGRAAEAAELKRQVEAAALAAARAEQRQAHLDGEIGEVLALVPNLLDDRVPEGEDERSNAVLGEWESPLLPRRVGKGFLWHDEVARSLRGLDAEAAARLSGSRFSVLVG